MKNILRPPCRRGQRVLHRFLNQLICQFMIKFSLRNFHKLLKLLGIFTPPPPPPPPPPALRHKLTLGIGLVEVLIASVIGGVVMLGSIKGLSFALQAAQVSRSILTENDFRLTVSKALKTACVENLKPARLTGSNSAKGIGTLAEITKPSIGTGIYKKDVDVVKMELKGEPTSETRTFVAFYKKTGLGELNTVGNQDCSATDTSGCFYQTCRIDYKFKVDDTTTTEDESLELAECNPFDCNESAMHLAGVNCENTHGHGFSVAGFDDSGQPICKNLTADANPCPFGTQLKGYKTDGRPDCTAKRTCPTGYLLQSDGSCFITEYSEDSAKDCLQKNTIAEAREVCAASVTLKNRCHYTIQKTDEYPIRLRPTETPGFCQGSTNNRLYKYQIQLFRRGPYDRETGGFSCFVRTKEVPVVKNTPPLPLLDSEEVYMWVRTGTQVACFTYLKDHENRGWTIRRRVQEGIDEILSWKRK